MKKDRNKFTYIWSSCLILIVAFCLVGMLSVKGTKAASTYVLEGKWSWNDGELTTPGYWNGTVNIDWGYDKDGSIQTQSGGKLKYADDVQQYGTNLGGNFVIKDYKLNYTDSYGNKYQSLSLLRGTRSNIYYISYDSSYVAPSYNSTYAKDYPYLLYGSADGRTEIININYEMSQSNYTSWQVDKARYQTIDFGYSKQTVTEEFYKWFTSNATLGNACYYNPTSKKFEWTNDIAGKNLYKIFKTESECSKGVQLTLKDSYGNLQDCSSGTCASKTKEISLKVLPGEYKLGNSSYKIERPGYKLSYWKIKSYNYGSQFGSGNETRTPDGSLSFSASAYQYTLEAVWELAPTLTLKDTYGNLQDCSSGTCGSKTKEIVLKASSGEYKLGNSNYKIERPGYKLSHWKIKSYNNGVQFGSGNEIIDSNGSLSFNASTYQYTLEAVWESNMSLTLNDPYGNLRDCSSGTCGLKTKSIVLKASSGHYSLGNSNYKIERPGYKLSHWKIKSYNYGSQFGSGNEIKTPNGILNFSTSSYQYTLEAVWESDMSLTLNDPYGNLRDCSFGTCGSNVEKIVLNVSPGEYKLGNSNYKIERPGYKLSHWKINSYNYGSQFGSGNETRTPDGSLSFSTSAYQYTLEAVWEKEDSQKCLIEYELNGGTLTNEFGITLNKSSDEVACGTGITLPYAQRKCYDFTGWYTTKSGKNKVGDAGGSYVLDSSITLYAQWKENGTCSKKNYTVTYAGGTCPNEVKYLPSDQTKIQGVSLKLSSALPYCSGYKFKEWNTKNDGSGKSYASGDVYNKNENLNLYAIWEEYSDDNRCNVRN